MKLTKTSAVVVLTALIAGTVFAGGGQQGGQPSGGGAAAKSFDLVISHIVNEDNSWHKASVFFKEQIEQRSSGRIKVTIHPNSEIGTEADGINSVANEGGVDMIFTGESMQSVIPEAGVIGVPYMIANYEHLRKVLASPVETKLEELLAH